MNITSPNLLTETITHTLTQSLDRSLSSSFSRRGHRSDAIVNSHEVDSFSSCVETKLRPGSMRFRDEFGDSLMPVLRQNFSCQYCLIVVANINFSVAHICDFCTLWYHRHRRKTLKFTNKRVHKHLTPLRVLFTYLSKYTSDSKDLRMLMLIDVKVWIKL